MKTSDGRICLRVTMINVLYRRPGRYTLKVDVDIFKFNALQIDNCIHNM
jgi:hypothetical protein